MTDCDFVRLGAVCTLASDRTHNVNATEAALRRGPYPLYADNCAVRGVEDWEFEAGGTIMVPAIGTVLASDGRLMAYYEQGRCGATGQVLPLIPHDPADGRYLWRVLTTAKAPASCVGGTHQLREVSAPGLMGTRIPWPGRAVRDAYVAALDGLEARIAELADLPGRLLAEGDAAFSQLITADAETTGSTARTGTATPGGGVGPACATAQARRVESIDRTASAGVPAEADGLVPAAPCARSLAVWRAGTNVPASDRGALKPVSIEGPSGPVGRCDEALAAERCIVMGATARRALVHVCPGPCHPLADTIYVTAESCSIPLPVLFFALRDAGIPERVRRDGATVPAAACTLDQALDLPLRVGEAQQWNAFLNCAEKLFDQIDLANTQREQAIADRIDLIITFEKIGQVPAGLLERYGIRPVEPPDQNLAYQNGTDEQANRQRVIGGDSVGHYGPDKAAGGASEKNSVDLSTGERDAGHGVGREGTPVCDGAPASTAPAPDHADRAASMLFSIAAATASSCGITIEDALWEVAPLALLRARLDPPLWNALASMARDLLDGGRDADLPRFVGIAFQQVASTGGALAFAAGFSGDDSALDAAATARVIAALDGIERESVDASALRGLFLVAGSEWGSAKNDPSRTSSGHDTVAGAHGRGPAAPAPSRTPSTPQLASVVDAAVRACGARIEADDLVELAYVPCDGHGMMVDAASRRIPRFTLATHTADPAQTLADSLVRGLLVGGDDVAGQLAALEGDLPAHDTAPDLKASLVLADLPPNAGEWCTGAVDRNDPRWLLGAPPRNKANFAWLQHCMHHLAPGGLAVVLATNAPLHSGIGSEPELRRALARSGRLRMAAALPARLGGSDGPARTLLVLGDEQPAQEWRCLMVNALDAGIPSPDDPKTRFLTKSTLAQLCDLCDAWIEHGRTADIHLPHVVVGMQEVEAHDHLLAPWEYA